MHQSNPHRIATLARRAHGPSSLPACAAALAACVSLAGCGRDEPPKVERAKPVGLADDSAPGPDGMPVYRDVTALTRIDFRHDNGARGKRYMPETLGSGVAVIDYDGDGLQDLYFVNSCEIKDESAPPCPGGNRLYKNLGGFEFQDVTASAKVAGRGCGMGAVVGDYDGDGRVDLYVTCFGSNVLYKNSGDGTFSDVTKAAHADDKRWSTGAAFLDFDGDRRLDLFVQNYVEYSAALHRPCFSGSKQIYCTPDQYHGTSSSLFRGRGDGTFEDVSESSGVASAIGKGLGVCVADYDNDGRPDIFCANDTSMNFLFHNLDGKRFEELGLSCGAGFSEHGREEAGMGVDGADFNQDGTFDIIVTNFWGEPNSIYRNDGGLDFTETSAISGTATISRNRLGFGVRWFDFDNDGLQDIVVANGGIHDNGAEITPPVPHAQVLTLHRGLGKGRFADLTDKAGKSFAAPIVGRGLALADLDNDGDQDLVVTVNGKGPKVFENVGGNKRSWVVLRLVATNGDTTAIGARATLTAGQNTQLQEVRSGASYLSQSDLRLFFGLGDAEKIDRIVVRWPGGATEEARDLPARRQYTFTEGQGVSGQE